MRNTFKTIFAFVLAVCMLITVAGCGDKQKETSSAASVDDSFFGDDTSKLEAAPSSSENSVSGNNSTTSSNGSSTGSTGSITTNVPTENQIGGKSFDDILKNMPKKLRGTKLVMYNWNPANEYTGAPAVMEQFKKKTGISVEWTTISHRIYFSKLPAIIASGENIPDLARIGYADIDFIQNLQPLSNTKFDFTDEAWDQSMMKALTFNGKVYGTTLKNTHVSGIEVLFYNKAIFDKEDYEDPYKLWKAGKWTWDKYIEMCEDAMDDGYYIGAVGEQMMTGYMKTWNVVGVGYNGIKFYTNWNSPQFLKVFQELGDRFHGSRQIFGYGQEEAFNAGNVPFYCGTTVHGRNKNSYFGNLKANKTLYFVPIPEHEELKGKYYQGYGEIEAYGVPTGAKNPEAVPYFLRYFLDGANYTLDTYFGNKQNLEVYNWCMNQTKVIDYGFGPESISKGYGGTKGIHANTGSQMKSFIDSNKGVNDKYIKELNDILAKLK